MGTGLNLPYYDFGRVESFTGLDLSEGMLRRAAGKVAGLGPAAAAKVRLVQGSAARLPFGAGEFDTVVLTYVLCVLDDPLGALREITRVCKREGRVVLVEQTASDLGPLAAYQRALAPAVRATSKGEARAPGGLGGRLGGRVGADASPGCDPSRDVVGLAEQAGLQVLAEETSMASTIRMVELYKPDWIREPSCGPTPG